MKKAKVNPAARLITLQHINLSYCEPSLKREYHSQAKKVLRLLAKELGLLTSGYDLRSNMGGIAVSGEITLHSDHFYIQISQGSFANSGIMFRECDSRSDYHGQHNTFERIEALLNLPAFAKQIVLATSR